MKKMYILILTLLVAVTAANAQAGWITHVGDNRISVKFPTEPKELSPGSFIAVGKDSVAFVFTIVDFVAVAGIDSVALAPMKATPEFAAQMKTEMKQNLPDVEMADFTIGTWKGFTSYTSTGLDSKKKKYNMFMFIIGNKLYSVSTVRNDGVGTSGPDNFVNSIMVSN